MRPCLPRIGFNVLVLGMLFGAIGSPVPAMNAETNEETEVHTFPRELTVSSYARSGDYHYYGSSDGLWRRTDWHEADNADHIWGQSGQAIAGMAVWGDTVIVAAGKTLALGSVEDGYPWREVPATAITPSPEQPWQDVRLLAWRFVARAERYYTSKEGDTWEALATGDRVVVAVGGSGDWLWCIANQPGRPGHVLGRSEDGRNWTWSEPLPEGFKPDAGFFAVLEGSTAVAAGSLGGGQAGAPAILSFVWPDEGAARWQLFVHASDKNGGRIALAQTSGGVWARLPNGDVAASVTGFDWMRFAENPLGTANTWLLSDGPNALEVTLATKGGRHVTFHDEQVEYAGRGGAPEIAWLEVKGFPPPADDAPMSVADIAQQMLDGQKASAKAVNELLAKHPAAVAKPATVPAAAPARPPFQILTTGEGAIRNMDLAAAEIQPEGPARKQALDAYHRKWDEKLRFRQLAEKLYYAAAMPDTEANGMARSATLLGISRTEAALFGKTPEDPGNRLMLPSLLSVVQNRIPREQHAGVLDRILRDVPTLADIWVLRAGYHIEAAEWDLADGSLAVARLLNPAEPSLERMETRLDARRPALTNEQIIRQRFARTWEEAEASTDDELRSRDPAADYATGLDYEQGRQGRDVKERIDRAKFHYLKAALADHVPAMLGYVRVANASLQQPGLSETSRTAIEKEIVSWVGKAADRGNGEALRVRALWRANGQAGFTADKGMAWLELERAAEAGDWPAMRLLAQAAHAGEWGRQDFKVVENWLERARAAGDPEAGSMLEELRKQHEKGKK